VIARLKRRQESISAKYFMMILVSECFKSTNILIIYRNKIQKVSYLEKSGAFCYNPSKIENRYIEQAQVTVIKVS